jgi:uncharacterized membrane protein YccC
MTRKSFLFITLCALIGAGITYWFSYPLVVWLSTLASHELILLVIAAFSMATIITVLWPETKHNRRSTDIKLDYFIDDLYQSTNDRLDKD